MCSRNPREIGNVIAQEFISCTYKLCADCDDDGQSFGTFLMEGQGLVLLLLLELYSEQVSLCCISQNILQHARKTLQISWIQSKVVSMCM